MSRRRYYLPNRARDVEILQALGADYDMASEGSSVSFSMYDTEQTGERASLVS
jgi:hypothetical protein